MNEEQTISPNRQFSVRKTIVPKPPNRNLPNSFQRAKNTILGNINELEGLKLTVSGKNIENNFLNKLILYFSFFQI